MRIRFEKEGHRYVSEEGTPYTSVSDFAKFFEEEKDWEKKARSYSAKLRKDGIVKSAKEILSEWENKRNRGTEAGTILHRIKEEQDLEGCERVTCSEWEDGYKWSHPISEIENDMVYPEFMIYSHEDRICGQSDRVTTKNFYIDIADYKTDKSIEKRGYGHEWGKPEKLKGCLSHLDDCNFNRYAIKMSTYMYLLWKENKGKFKPGKIELIWCQIERDKDGIPILHDGVPKILKEETIRVPYLKKEVINMLKEWNAAKNT